jgi:hypothetical protein
MNSCLSEPPASLRPNLFPPRNFQDDTTFVCLGNSHVESSSTCSQASVMASSLYNARTAGTSIRRRLKTSFSVDKSRLQQSATLPGDHTYPIPAPSTRNKSIEDHTPESARRPAESSTPSDPLSAPIQPAPTPPSRKPLITPQSDSSAFLCRAPVFVFGRGVKREGGAVLIYFKERSGPNHIRPNVSVHIADESAWGAVGRECPCAWSSFFGRA